MANQLNGKYYTEEIQLEYGITAVQSTNQLQVFYVVVDQSDGIKAYLEMLELLFIRTRDEFGKKTKLPPFTLKMSDISHHWTRSRVMEIFLS